MILISNLLVIIISDLPTAVISIHELWIVFRVFVIAVILLHTFPQIFDFPLSDVNFMVGKALREAPIVVLRG